MVFISSSVMSDLKMTLYQSQKKAYSIWKKVDVLVNNAGSELNQSYDKMTEKEWDKVLDTDLKVGTLVDAVLLLYQRWLEQDLEVLSIYLH